MDANTGERLSSSAYQPWYLGEPNGEDQENCGSITPTLGARMERQELQGKTLRILPDYLLHSYLSPKVGVAYR